MRKKLILAAGLLMAFAVKAQDVAVEITDQFANTDFEVGSTTGWTVSGTGPGAMNTAVANNYQGTYFMEAWTNSSGNLGDFDWSQTVEVPNGYYVVKALAHAIKQNQEVTPESKGIFVYANDEQVEVKSTVSAEYTIFAQAVDGALTIGYRGKSCNVNWVAVDYFRVLQCMGDTEEAAKLSWVKYELAALSVEAEELIASPMPAALLSQLEESIVAIGTVSTYAEADALWQSMKQQVADAKAAIIAYEELYDKLNNILSEILIDPEMNGYTDLETVVYASMDKYSAGSLDLAGVKAEIELLNDAVFAFNVANADGTVSFDVTEMFVTNPTVRTKEATEGWTITVTNENNAMPAWGHNCIEFWYCDFELSQTITDLPNGKYVIKLQGFYREGAMNDGSNLGNEKITAELFGNKSSVPLTSIYQYKASTMGVTANVHGTYDYINGLESANLAFSTLNPITGRNYYDDNELTVIVMDGKLTFGVRNSSSVFDRWCAFRDFRLMYYGNFPGLNLASKIQEINHYLEDNVDNIPGAVALEVSDYVWELENSGLTAPNAPEADVNAAILALDSVWAEAQVSFGIFEDLKALVYKVDNETMALGYPGKDALQTVLREAQTYLVPEIEINTREAMLEMIEKLNAAIVTYVFSQPSTRENPADVTYFLVEPFSTVKNYDIPVWETEVVGEDKGDVWVGPGRDWIIGADTTKTYCLNSWSNNFVSMDAYQEITGIPNGMYSVTADAITQSGCLNDQHVYAASSMGIAVSDTLSIEGWDPSEWETLTTALMVVVDGKLRIGFSSTSTGNPGTNGWFQIANFKLSYHGEATADDLKAAWDNTLARANDAVDILLIGDEGSLITTIGAATPLALDAKYAEACGMLNPAVDDLALAINTTKKFYNGHYNTLKTDTTYVKYEYVPQVAENTVTLVNTLLAVDTITYKALAPINTKLSSYINYISGLKEVEDVLNDTLVQYEEKAVEFFLNEVLKPQVDSLASELRNGKDCDTLLIRLKDAFSRLKRTELITLKEGDVTHLIKNPTVDAIDGWVVLKNDATNCGTNKSEHYSGDASNTYLDAWNGTAGKMNSTFYQELEGIPNGLYRLTAAARADGDNAWIFAATENAKAESTKWAMVKRYGAFGGEIWEAAKAEWEAAGSPADGDFPFFTTRADSTGYGWSWHVIDSIEVTDRYLLFGLSADKNYCGKEQGYTGTWMGADDWKLELIKKTEDGTYDPYVGVDNVEAAPVIIVRDGAIYSSTGAPVAVYSIDGKRSSAVGLSRGIYIVRCENTVTKVVVR